MWLIDWETHNNCQNSLTPKGCIQKRYIYIYLSSISARRQRRKRRRNRGWCCDNFRSLFRRRHMCVALSGCGIIGEEGLQERVFFARRTSRDRDWRVRQASMHWARCVVFEHKRYGVHATSDNVEIPCTFERYYRMVIVYFRLVIAAILMGNIALHYVFLKLTVILGISDAIFDFFKY